MEAVASEMAVVSVEAMDWVAVAVVEAMVAVGPSSVERVEVGLEASEEALGAPEVSVAGPADRVGWVGRVVPVVRGSAHS